MRLLSDTLQKHVEQQVTSLATCWKLQLKNGNILGFTNYHNSLLIDNIKYEARSGFNIGALDSDIGLAVDNIEIEAILDSNVLKTEDILSGLYDLAEIEVFLVNYLDLPSGKIILKRGILGEIRLYNGRFISEVRGLTQKLSTCLCEVYSATCRARFGDQKCQVNLKNYTANGSIMAVLAADQLLDEQRTEPIGYYDYGKLTFISGNNVGISMDIKEYFPGNIITVLALPYEVKPGDNYEITAGCDKSFTTCCQRYNNAVNFRGEPHIPGVDEMLKTAATT